MALDLGLFVAPIRLLANGKYQIAPVPAPTAEEKPASTTTYKFGGYAKFDSMFTDYSDSAPSGNSLMRQFYYAPQVPIGDGTGSSDMTADFQARESRLNFRANVSESAHE